MRVFVTGATGFIGSAIVKELLGAGHRVIGLARSEAAATSLTAAGAEVHRGELADLDSLRRGAAAAEAAIHTGFIHDFANFKAVCEIDRRAIEALGSAFAESRRPLIVTSGTGLLAPGQLAREDDVHASGPDAFPRVASEEAASALASRGVRVAVMRLPPSVHGDGDHGFVPALIGIARNTRVSAYVGDGANRWPAVHRLDAARLYRLAIESEFSPGARFHGIAEEGIAFRRIAEVIGRQLDLPVVGKSAAEAAAHFGWLARFAGLDCPASSQQTQDRLDWHPTHAGLIADLDRPDYA
jgi:nucleoside-diphosphate-sugar epimerase